MGIKVIAEGIVEQTVEFGFGHLVRVGLTLVFVKDFVFVHWKQGAEVLCNRIFVFAQFRYILKDME
jgi:hypothetical protein